MPLRVSRLQRPWLFQSAPGLEAGRCAKLDAALELAYGVSIRARPRGRAMRAKS